MSLRDTDANGSRMVHSSTSPATPQFLGRRYVCLPTPTPKSLQLALSQLTLDPENWDEIRELGHRMLDECSITSAPCASNLRGSLFRRPSLPPCVSRFRAGLEPPARFTKNFSAPISSLYQRQPASPRLGMGTGYRDPAGHAGRHARLGRECPYGGRSTSANPG